ncbi:MAG: hypothetical protein ACREFC_09450 [Stellaceae bacterium]
MDWGHHRYSRRHSHRLLDDGHVGARTKIETMAVAPQLFYQVAYLNLSLHAILLVQSGSPERAKPRVPNVSAAEFGIVEAAGVPEVKGVWGPSSRR